MDQSVNLRMSELTLTSDQGQSEPPQLAVIILPELVWEKVLESVTDPDDVLNAGKTCTLFERLLREKMVAANLSKTLPVLMNYLDDKSILKCRLVSKGWRTTLDNFFEDYFLKGAYTGKPYGLAPFAMKNNSLYSFTNDADLMHGNGSYFYFMQAMKDHPRNPIVGRAVHFDLVFMEEENQFDPDFRIFADFFTLFGKHIWTLHLDVMDVSNAYPDGVQERSDLLRFVMRDLFLLAPNLKSLLIDSMDVRLPIRMTDEEINALTPPPVLERLVISGTCQDFREVMMRRHLNTQFKFLRTQAVATEPFYHQTYPNLKELHFSIEIMNELVRIRNFNAPQPQLEVLELSFWASVVFGGYSQADVFRAILEGLEALVLVSPNLKTLRFRTKCFFPWDKELDEPMGFPQLEDIQCHENIKTLQIPDNLFTFVEGRVISDYSFLLSFPHVENIQIAEAFSGARPEIRFSRNMLERIWAKEIVRVYQFMYDGRMYESNIWELLPSLKTFSFGKRIYTRSAYERRMRRIE